MDAIASFGTSKLFPTLEGNVNCIALFNHEEIGSVSSTGAESSLVPTFLERLSPTPATLGQSVARSFLISSDMGHAIHPNYTKKHEDNHAPKLNGGVVIKTNAKQRYASDAIGSFIVKQLVESKGGRVQEYETRNDMYVPLSRILRFVESSVNECYQALWVHCWPILVQTRYPNCGCWMRNALDALDSGDSGFA